MKKVYRLTVLFFVFVLVSCGVKEGQGESLELINPSEDKATSGLKISEVDEPIHYKDLQKFLPIAIEGYEMEDPEGTALDMQGYSVSSAMAEYLNSSGGYIRISILDYNAAKSLYKTSTSMWGMGITIDSDDEYAKSFTLSNGLSGWETFEKINKKANVVIGVQDRLLITVESNNQIDTQKSKDVIALINLDFIALVIKKD